MPPNLFWPQPPIGFPLHRDPLDDIAGDAPTPPVDLITTYLEVKYRLDGVLRELGRLPFVTGRFHQFNPLISCRQCRLEGVSKNERLTRRFPGARFRG